MSGAQAVDPAGDDTSQIVTDATIERLLDRARADLAVDTAAVLLLDESQQFLVATAARGVEEEVRQGVRVRAGTGFAGRIAAERRPVILDRVTRDNVVNPLLLRRGIVSMLGVPLMAEKDVIGVLHVGMLQPRAFGPNDVAALERAGRRISTALLRHRAFIDRAAARALQASLIPRLPELPGLDLAARYVPGGQYGVGGDWYDVFRLPSGPIGITIGDVMGHGLHAATMMGRVRSSLRSYALEHTCPARVLERLDRKIHYFEPGLMCTIAYAVLDPVEGRMLLSTAGHLPPALAVPGEPARLVDVEVDPPIGVDPRIVRRFSVEHLPPGSMLCLFTDGLVERRTSDLDDDLDRLCAVLTESAAGSADAACAEIMSAMLDGRTPADDVSLLVLKSAPAAG